MLKEMEEIRGHLENVFEKEKDEMIRTVEQGRLSAYNDIDHYLIQCMEKEEKGIDREDDNNPIQASIHYGRLLAYVEISDFLRKK
jgi:hypothetical protein